MSEQENQFVPLSDQEDLIPLSYLSQYGYCPRRCGLLGVDGLWNENQYTAEGRSSHQKVHTTRVEKRGDLITLYEYGIFSHLLGVNGLCDCIELHVSNDGVKTPYSDKPVQFYPIEYKHGIVRNEHEYHLQLCAQAMCLEERFGTNIPYGAIFFIDAHRRDEVRLDEKLRTEVKETAQAIRNMIASGVIPEAKPSSKCSKCSMIDICTPKVSRNAEQYVHSLWQYAVSDEN